MSVTGHGRHDDPLIVHSYEELQYVAKNLSDPNYRESRTEYNGSNYVTWEPQYVELDCDIDCNDYGANFVWDTVVFNVCVDLNLKGHTIQNVMLGPNAAMFRFNGTIKESSDFDTQCALWPYQKIYNGALLNIFSNNSYGLCLSGVSNEYDYGCLEKIQLSGNINGIQASAFDRVGIKESAIYVEGSNYDGILYYNCNNITLFKDVDFYFDLGKPVSINTSLFNNGWGSTANTVYDGCRFQGDIRETRDCYYSDIRDVGSSVFNLSMDSNIVSAYESSRAIINTDLITNPSESYPNILVTTEEMHDAAALTAKGFTVIDIGQNVGG